MLAKPEQYKGIMYIRISSLPGEQKSVIQKNFKKESIIKIIKDNSLINDCIQYPEYVRWYKQFSADYNPNSELPTSIESIDQGELVNK